MFTRSSLTSFVEDGDFPASRPLKMKMECPSFPVENGDVAGRIEAGGG